MLALAVKYSVELSVESLISRYEVHFDKSRQLGEEKAHMEMFVSMNGPVRPIIEGSYGQILQGQEP